MSELIFVYITCENHEQAEKIGETLVDEGLAACANIFPESTSIYKWEGKLTHNEECMILLKTRASMFARLEARVKEMHSYEVPCIVSFVISDGNQDFLDWVKKQTAS